MVASLTENPPHLTESNLVSSKSPIILEHSAGEASNTGKMKTLDELRQLVAQPRTEQPYIAKSPDVLSQDTQEMIERWVAYYFVGGEDLGVKVAAPSAELVALNELAADRLDIPVDERTKLFEGVHEFSSSHIVVKKNQLVVSWSEYDAQGKVSRTREFPPLDFSEQSLLIEIFGSYDNLYRALRVIFTAHFSKKYPKTSIPEHLRSVIEQELSQMVYEFLNVIAKPEQIPQVLKLESVKSDKPIVSNVDSAELLAMFLKTIALRKRTSISPWRTFDYLGLPESVYLASEHLAIAPTQLNEVMEFYRITRQSLHDSFAEFADPQEDDMQQLTILPDFSGQNPRQIFEGFMMPPSDRWKEHLLHFFDVEGNVIPVWDAQTVENAVYDLLKHKPTVVNRLRATRGKDEVLRELLQVPEFFQLLIETKEGAESKKVTSEDEVYIYDLTEAVLDLVSRLNKQAASMTKHIAQSDQGAHILAFMRDPKEMSRYIRLASVGEVCQPKVAQFDAHGYRDTQWVLAGLFKGVEAYQLRLIDEAVEGSEKVVMPSHRDDLLKKIDPYTALKGSLLFQVSFFNSDMIAKAIEHAFYLSRMIWPNQVKPAGMYIRGIGPQFLTRIRVDDTAEATEIKGLEPDEASV